MLLIFARSSSFFFAIARRMLLSSALALSAMDSSDRMQRSISSSSCRQTVMAAA